MNKQNNVIYLMLRLLKPNPDFLKMIFDNYKHIILNQIKVEKLILNNYYLYHK